MDMEDASSDEVQLTHISSNPQFPPLSLLKNPSPSLLVLLRQLLLLLSVWNKSLPKPMIPVSSECWEVWFGMWLDWCVLCADGALALLFKVLTVFNLSPQSPLSEELQSGEAARLFVCNI